MILALAALALASPPQMVKQVDVDLFNTPYEVTLNGTSTDAHEWQALSWKQCMFYRRNTNLRINSNPNHTTLTFTLGQGLMSFVSPMQVSWFLNLNYFTLDGTYTDLSRVKRFYVDCDHIPDIAEMYAFDKWFHGGVSGPSGQPNGVYFNRAGFTGNIDWKNVYNVKFRLDFSSAPNPLTFKVFRIYVTLEPGLGGPGSKVAPLGMLPDG